MDVIIQQMTELMEQARQQGVDDACDHLNSWQEGLGTGEYEQSYLDGVADALITIQQLA